jgi:hypothetical protein
VLVALATQPLLQIVDDLLRYFVTPAGPRTLLPASSQKFFCLLQLSIGTITLSSRRRARAGAAVISGWPTLAAAWVGIG